MNRPFLARGLHALWYALLLCACGGSPSSAPELATLPSGLGDAGPPVNYAYDESRRLVGVYDGTGASAQYVYDKGGNLLEIKRLTATDLGLFDFSPNSGGPGSEVILTGTGFSTTPTSNFVSFHGVAAVVTAASAQRLVVSVPAGATTGPVSVTVGSVTATSNEDFEVAAQGGGPSITGFSPVGGPIGTTVTITGTNFNPDRLYNRVFIGGVQASIISATATQLVVKIGSQGATGRVRVSTSAGHATSTTDFLVMPSANVPGGLDTVLEPVVGGAPVNISLPDVTRKAVLKFPVQRGEQVSIVASSVVTGGAFQVALQIEDQQGTEVSSVVLTPAGGVLDAPIAPKDGIYTAVLRISGSTTGFSATLALVRALRGVLEKDGATTTFTNQAGQNGTYDFVGGIGEHLGLGVSSITTTPTGQILTLKVFRPGGLEFITCPSITGPNNCDLPPLPMAGTYTVSVNPPGTVTASVGILLSRSVGGNLTVDGSAATFSTARVGQDGFYTFTASANANLSLVLTGITFASGTKVQVLKADGSELASLTTNATTGYTVDFTVPTAGTYGIAVDPPLASTGQMTLKLVGEATGSAGLIDGTVTSVSLGAGQNGRYTFSGTAGDRLGLGIPSLSTVPSGGSVAISVFKPDGTLLVNCPSITTPDNCELPVLSVTGTYAITINPAGVATASMGLLLSRSVEGSLTVDGSAATFSTARVGQDGFYTFTASANANLSLVLTGITFASGTKVQVLKADGSELASLTTNATTGYTVDFTVPTAGTYGIAVDPPLASTGQMTLKLVGEATGSAGLIDGTVTSVSLGAGQNGRYTFSGTAGDRLGLGIPSLSTVPSGGSVAISVFKPDGTLLVNCPSITTPDNCELPVLSVTGTYAITINPAGVATASMGLLLSRSVEGSLTVDGSAATFSTARVGQDGFYTFTASANANLSLVLTGITFATSTQLRVLKADGSQLASLLTSSTAGQTLDFTVPTAGTYSIEVDPYRASTGQITLQLITEATGSAGIIDGTVTSVSLGAGQNGRYTFSGTAGDRLGLGIPSLSTAPSGGSVAISVFKPDGTLLTGCGAFMAPDNCDLPVLSVTGTYVITVNPAGTAAATVGLLLSRSVEGSLTVDGSAATFSTTRVGQDGFYTFTASANANLSLVLTSATFTGGVQVTVWPPNGTTSVVGTPAFPNTSYTVNFTASTAGTYSIRVDPNSANTGQITLRVKTQGAPFAPARVEVAP
ncbi:PPC domain-containing protein [Corallococcus sp. EGB]|uniref:beta strand repeat-containing protein n=1 Tax=Corallococcus sp. EGB TaxID=1521117 RepID=UPI001CBFE650|nr:PPC domain-containing protein [Corallococcus sp. EGB]